MIQLIPTDAAKKDGVADSAEKLNEAHGEQEDDLD